MKKQTLLKKITEWDKTPSMLVEALDGRAKLWKSHFPNITPFDDAKSFLESFYLDEDLVFTTFQCVLSSHNIRLQDKDLPMVKEALPEIVDALGIK